MANSQNGHPLLKPDSDLLHKWILPGVPGRHFLLRNGSLGFLLVFFSTFFHKKVERLDLGVWDEWGYADRPIRGSETPSNHGSGTAVDLNATKHPLGVPTGKTFTAAQQRKIRRKLRYTFLGLIRWGGDYKNRPDSMHFEIVGSMAACERLARVLMKTPRGRRILKANPGQRAVIKS